MSYIFKQNNIFESNNPYASISNIVQNHKRCKNDLKPLADKLREQHTASRLADILISLI